LLVTNHSMLPTSRNLRDLIGYIEYHDHGETVDSAVVSVFDLLSRDYSARLQPLAMRLETSRPYKSENIMLTLLHEILAEDPYTDCLVACQVLLRNLLPDLTRLTPEQAAYARRRASIDFVIYNKDHDAAGTRHRGRRVRVPRGQPSPAGPRFAQERHLRRLRDTPPAAAHDWER
jgi:hypothetical protein